MCYRRIAMLYLKDKIQLSVITCDELECKKNNVFKEISKVSTSWQGEKTTGLMMSQNGSHLYLFW